MLIFSDSIVFTISLLVMQDWKYTQYYDKIPEQNSLSATRMIIWLLQIFTQTVLCRLVGTFTGRYYHCMARIQKDFSADLVWHLWLNFFYVLFWHHPQQHQRGSRRPSHLDWLPGKERGVYSYVPKIKFKLICYLKLML